MNETTEQFIAGWKKKMLLPIERPSAFKERIVASAPWIIGIVAVLTAYWWLKIGYWIVREYVKFLFFIS